MAAVSSVVFLKPLPGRLEALMRDIGRAQKMIKRMGGTLRAYNEASGPNAGAIALVVEHSDWKEYGNYMAKLETDKDWQSFVAEISSAKSPNAERVATGLNVELPS
ncbi:MAG TPA: hypothetical protein VJX68_09350 [Candidatus Binatus sp.]|uniref:hypothetical protein n=1 Tax=Candidatus Binatus sp. TaxID=2811406 RepID=UPI002B467385|nr:hypothetical protein [Candidatus Binatus sp.]HKN13390.1 hypothetical protein [Candidatus Binatus sp.]